MEDAFSTSDTATAATTDCRFDRFYYGHERNGVDFQL